MTTSADALRRGVVAAFLLTLACDAARVPSIDPEPSKSTLGEGPALWLANDEDTSVYLFGTIHLLPPDVRWRTPTIDAAFDSASVVYFECDDFDDLDPQLLSLLIYPEGQTLAQVLEPALLERVLLIFEREDFDLELSLQLRPWAAAIMIEVSRIQSGGAESGAGVDEVLESFARGDKQIREFETVEQQLRMFADLSEADQIELLRVWVESAEADSDIETFHHAVDAWLVGDVDALAFNLAKVDRRLSSASLQEVLLVNRNRDWTNQLQALMRDEAGIFFVAVGAAHLAGEHSVQAMLQREGIDVHRIQ